MHATQNYTVDAMLAILLILGGVVGAQVGVRLGVKLRAEQLRILLSIIVLGVCSKLALDLLLTPNEYFSIMVEKKDFKHIYKQCHPKVKSEYKKH